MQRIILFIAFTLLFACAEAQQEEIDSLLKKINNHPQNDSIKLNLLNTVSLSYSAVDAAKGLQFAGAAMLLAQQLRLSEKLAEAYVNSAVNDIYLNNDSLAAKQFQTAVNIFQQQKNEDKLALAYHLSGLAYYNKAGYNISNSYQQKSLAISSKSGDSTGVAAAANSIGINCFRLSDYPDAINFYFRALNIYEAKKDTANTGKIFMNLALVYENLEEYQKALDYNSKAAFIHSETHNFKSLADTYIHTGSVYDDMDNETAALYFYKKGEALSRQNAYSKGISSACINMSQVYTGLGDYKNALLNLQTANDAYRLSNDRYGMANVYTAIGNIYASAPAETLLQQNIDPQNRYQKAAGFYKKSLAIAIEISNISMQSYAWQNLDKIYEKQNDFGAALSAYKTYIVLRDSIVNDSKKQAVAKQEMQYEFDKKENIAKAEQGKKDAFAASELSRERIIKNSIIVVAALFFTSGILLFISYKRRRDAVTEKTEAELNAQVAETEMKALRAQMNPHFIFNSLNSISDYIAKNDTEAADIYLTKFAKVMRMILENSEYKEVPLADDLKSLELYMQLEAMRLQQKFSYKIIVDEDIDAEIILVPPLILQPFAENNIWHGLMHKQGAGKITVHIKKEDGMLNCIVEDNGIGREKSSAFRAALMNMNNKSLGIKITHERIDIINKLKNANARIRITDLEEGVRAEIFLPLQTAF